MHGPRVKTCAQPCRFPSCTEHIAFLQAYQKCGFLSDPFLFSVYSLRTPGPIWIILWTNLAIFFLCAWIRWITKKVLAQGPVPFYSCPDTQARWYSLLAEMTTHLQSSWPWLYGCFWWPNQNRKNKVNLISIVGYRGCAQFALLLFYWFMLSLPCQRHYTLCISWLFYRKAKKFKENVGREGTAAFLKQWCFTGRL